MSNSGDYAKCRTETLEMEKSEGVKAGITYRLPDGKMVYVPE
ncbi:DUF2149 domain-containing protein [Methylophaga sp.]